MNSTVTGSTSATEVNMGVFLHEPNGSDVGQGAGQDGGQSNKLALLFSIIVIYLRARGMPIGHYGYEPDPEKHNYYVGLVWGSDWLDSAGFRLYIDTYGQDSYLAHYFGFQRTIILERFAQVLREVGFQAELKKLVVYGYYPWIVRITVAHEDGEDGEDGEADKDGEDDEHDPLATIRTRWSSVVRTEWPGEGLVEYRGATRKSGPHRRRGDKK